jgi:3D-(3,5/4)-trihydroxycyclohexane-1,2-dione acylhydrolase (decyclizing)
MSTLRLPAAHAAVRYLAAQRTVVEGAEVPLFAGVWAIFGHGNVAGLGEALYHVRDVLPTYRAHNEQAMAHAAIAFAKAKLRRQMMACTTSIGPGALNMVTAAAVAHVNRLPLLLPGDTFANRRPDPVLQQIEDFGDATITANDCFKPVSRFFDRITRPEQLLASLPRAFQVLTDPAECGPVTLAMSQDVQAEAYDYPASFFEPRLIRQRRPMPDPEELEAAVALLARAERPLIIAGGGVLYAEAAGTLQEFAGAHKVPVAETQAGKGALPFDHPQNVGSMGVTGSSAANALAAEADVILAVGTRLQDFTTGSRVLLPGRARLIQLNVAAFDAGKHGAQPLVGDARRTLEALDEALGRPDHRRRLTGAGRDAGCRTERHGRSGHRGDERGAALGCPGAGRGQPGGAARCRGGLRRRRPAGRAAQALAHGRALWLSPGIRLLLHGLRDRGRPRGQDSAA